MWLDAAGATLRWGVVDDEEEEVVVVGVEGMVPGLELLGVRRGGDGWVGRVAEGGLDSDSDSDSVVEKEREGWRSMREVSKVLWMEVGCVILG